MVSQLIGRLFPISKALSLTISSPHSGRLSHNDRRIHREPRDRQAHPGTRHNLVLQIRQRCRHTSRGRYCPIPPRPLRHDQRPAPDYTGRSVHLPGALLLQQGPVEVRRARVERLGTRLTRSLALDSSSRAGTSATAARSTPSLSAGPCTNNHTRSVAQAQHTSTASATRTGRRA